MSDSTVYTDEPDLGALYAEVVLPLPLQRLFTYRLTTELFELAMPGKRVFVPFGNRKVYTGIIINITSKAPEHYEALNIISIIDDEPIISNEQLKFWNWIASYYLCGLGEVMSAALPAGMKLASETYIALQEEGIPESIELDPREIQILDALKGKEKVKISDLESILKSKSSLVKIVKSLYERQLIVMFEDITEKYKPKTISRIRVSAELQESDLNDLLIQLEKKAKSQYKVLLALIGEKGMDSARSELIKKFDLQAAAVKALLEKGIIQQYEVETDRLSKRADESGEYQLSTSQSQAIQNIKAHFDEDKSVLLHGETASGKTFIYIELIKEYLSKGKSVLYLIPEIALSEQLISRLNKYFGNEMMVSHSRFSMNEKVEIWNKTSQGEVKLLLGSRSSLFMPLRDLGLIIIDEEHEPAFKQHEKAPRYHARDAAMVLARQNGAKVLLGSATPSMESYYNALSGKYALVTLSERYGTSLQPDIVLADIKEESRTKSMRGIFTSRLFDELSRLQAEKTQAILFQNRKGYVPMLECSTCGWVSKCVNCDIALTYYKYSNNLRCHYCGYHQGNISKCQACGNNTMSIQGYGTERITEELETLLPELRVIRFDQDSTRQKNAYSRLLNDFENGKADVMVGTQIAVKGLDYGNVKICSVINADHLLNFPDFRSHERTFQLLYQLAGRAGRRTEKGLMIIQSRMADHPLIKHLINKDYVGFYNEQIIEREQFNYPPFSKLIRITLKHRSADSIQSSASEFSILLKKQLGARILGPETPFISKIRNQYLRNFMIKMDVNTDNPQKIKKFIQDSFDFLVKRDNIKGLTLIADVDPY